jgi:hypothetical protein
MRQWIYLTYRLVMTSTTIEDIIVKHIKTLNRGWFNKKLKEFKSSPLYDRDKQILFHKEVQILQNPIEELDEEGLVVNITIQDEREIENIININFREFCKSSNYYKDGGTYYPYHLAEIESLVKGSKIEIYQFGFEEVSENLINDLNIFKEDLTPGNIWDYITSVVQSIKLEFEANLEGAEEIYSNLREDICQLCSEQLRFQYANKLFLHKIHGTYRDKLNIKLNIEDFSALLLLMFNANILSLDKTTYDFFEKYITLGQLSKPHSFTSRSLEQKVSKQRTLSGGKGLDNIRDAFAKPIKNYKVE